MDGDASAPNKHQTVIDHSDSKTLQDLAGQYDNDDATIKKFHSPWRMRQTHAGVSKQVQTKSDI